MQNMLETDHWSEDFHHEMMMRTQMELFLRKKGSTKISLQWRKNGQLGDPLEGKDGS
jgi:hypothetical protein